MGQRILLRSRELPEFRATQVRMRGPKLAAGVLALAFALDAGAAWAISNGSEDSADEFPFVVRVDSSKGACSGVAVAPTKILTAAHCTGDVAMDDLRIKVFRSEGEATFRVASILTPPDFDPQAPFSGNEAPSNYGLASGGGVFDVSVLTVDRSLGLSYYPKTIKSILLKDTVARLTRGDDLMPFVATLGD